MISPGASPILARVLDRLAQPIGRQISGFLSSSRRLPAVADIVASPKWSDATNEPQRIHRINIWFWLIVVIPASFAALYYFFIASDLYMSEARFIVRSERGAPDTMLGTLLQGTSYERSSDDAYAVESFISSRDAVRKLAEHDRLSAIFDRPGADFITRFPNFVSGKSFEALFQHYLDFVTVAIDSSTGVTTLQVKAYRPEDAQAVARALLRYSERLVNDLNRRAENDAIREARNEVNLAAKNLADVEQRLTLFRIHERMLDPALASTSVYSTLTSLTEARIGITMQLAALARDSPNNPSIPRLKTQLAALNAQIAASESSATGVSGSVAGKLGGYERLDLERELDAQLLASATTSLETARQEAQSKHLYIEHIAEPGLPDYPLYPKRFLSFCIVLAACLLVYGIAWLLVAGVREHGSA